MRKFCFCLILFITQLAQGSAQVSLQTGSATFNLPMFSWTDNSSRLNSIIALSYNSGNGLKVNDVASSVGQGWNLAAGGTITRIQVGEPDDQKPRDGNVDDLTKYPPGILYNTVDISQGCPIGLAKYPIFQEKNKIYKQNIQIGADRERDYFTFQFNGRSGMFVLNSDNTGSSLGDSRIRIWFTRNESMANNNIRTTIDGFYIQDENGLIYKFSNLDLTKVLKNGYADRYSGVNNTTEINQPNIKSNNVYYQSSFDKIVGVQYIVSGWHLTEIKDALTGRTVTFNYVIRNIDAVSGVQLMYFKEKNYSVVAQKRSVTTTPVISSISYPDGHLVQFYYDKERADMKGDYSLSSIDIKYKDRFLSRYMMNTSYFILNRYGTPVSDTGCAVMFTFREAYGCRFKSRREPLFF